MLNVKLAKDVIGDKDISYLDARSAPIRRWTPGIFSRVYSVWNGVSHVIWRTISSIVSRLVSMFKYIFITRGKENCGNHLASSQNDKRLGLWYKCMKVSTPGGISSGMINPVTLLVDVWIKLLSESETNINLPLNIPGIPRDGPKTLFSRMSILIDDIFRLKEANAFIVCVFSNDLLWLLPQPFASFITNIKERTISDDAILEQYELLVYIMDALHIVLNTQTVSQQNCYIGILNLLLVKSCVIEGEPDPRTNNLGACITCWVKACKTSLKDVLDESQQFQNITHERAHWWFKTYLEYINLEEIYKFDSSDFRINFLCNRIYRETSEDNENNVGMLLLFFILKQQGLFKISRFEQLNNEEEHNNVKQGFVRQTLCDCKEIVGLISGINRGFACDMRDVNMEEEFKNFCDKYNMPS